MRWGQWGPRGLHVSSKARLTAACDAPPWPLGLHDGGHPLSSWSFLPHIQGRRLFVAACTACGAVVCVCGPVPVCCAAAWARVSSPRSIVAARSTEKGYGRSFPQPSPLPENNLCLYVTGGSKEAPSRAGGGIRGALAAHRHFCGCWSASERSHGTWTTMAGLSLGSRRHRCHTVVDGRGGRGVR